MSAAEAPKSEQIQANVAAALSRLRGELGATSSPVAGTTLNPVPKTPTDPAEPSLGMPSLGGAGLGGGTMNAPNLTPLPAGPVRMPDADRPTIGTRPFEPTLGAALGTPAGAAPATPGNDDVPILAAQVLDDDAPKPDLFARMRAEPVLKAERDPSADAQPDLLSGMEVPPAPPPPLGSFATDDEVGGRGKRMRNRILALLVLGIVVGGAGWAYLSKHRAAEGPVPVITADTTPEKVKPTDEGGMQVPNQNVQILDNMNGQSTGQGQEKVLPPPEQPVAPPAPDATAETAPAASGEGAATATNAPSAVDQPAVPSVAAPPIPAVSAPEPGQATANAAAPVAQQAAPEPSAPAAAAPAASDTTQAQATQPATPAATPAAPAKTEAATQAAAAPTAPAATPAPAAGGIRVQLAAVKSEAAAKTQWAKLQKAHSDLLGGLTLNLQTVDKGGVTYYRIQAGPLASKAAAKALCTKLAAQKQDCIVAK